MANEGLWIIRNKSQEVFMSSCQGKINGHTCNGIVYKCEKCGSVGCKKMLTSGNQKIYCTNYIGQPNNPASHRCCKCGGNLKAL